MRKIQAVAMQFSGVAKIVDWGEETVQTSVKIPVSIHAKIRELATLSKNSMNDTMVLLLDVGADAVKEEIDRQEDEWEGGR